jgi:hypothetical protein
MPDTTTLPDSTHGDEPARLYLQEKDTAYLLPVDQKEQVRYVLNDPLTDN